MDLSIPKSDVVLKASLGLSLTEDEKVELTKEVTEAAKGKYFESHKAGTILNDSDGFYAGEVTCICDKHGEKKTCSIRKTGWIFEKESDAQEYADKMLQDMFEELLEAILDHLGTKGDTSA